MWTARLGSGPSPKSLERGLRPKRGGEDEMRFAYHATMCDSEFYLPLAMAAEEVGFDPRWTPKTGH